MSSFCDKNGIFVYKKSSSFGEGRYLVRDKYGIWMYRGFHSFCFYEPFFPCNEVCKDADEIQQEDMIKFLLPPLNFDETWVCVEFLKKLKEQYSSNGLVVIDYDPRYKNYHAHAPTHTITSDGVFLCSLLHYSLLQEEPPYREINNMVQQYLTLEVEDFSSLGDSLPVFYFYSDEEDTIPLHPVNFKFLEDKFLLGICLSGIEGDSFELRCFFRHPKMDIEYELPIGVVVEGLKETDNGRYVFEEREEHQEIKKMKTEVVDCWFTEIELFMEAVVYPCFYPGQYVRLIDNIKHLPYEKYLDKEPLLVKDVYDGKLLLNSKLGDIMISDKFVIPV